MINLLPPEIKEQVRFSKRNVVLRRYAILTTFVAAVLLGTLLGAHVFADRQIANLEDGLEEKRMELVEYEELESQVGSLDSRLNTISRLYDQQTRFSALLEDLADVLPDGAFINSIVLTGEADQPVQITVSTASFTQAGTINGALSSSERIESVDIQSINASEGGRYSVNVVLAFSEDGAR